MAFVPGEAHERTNRVEPFDFDNALFTDLWNPKNPAPFLAYIRYYVSDHRPVRAEFSL
jgi:hypothetical protein